MWLCKLLFLAFILGVANSSKDPFEDKVSRLANEITKWAESGQESPQFRQMLDNLTFKTSMQHQNWRTFIGLESELVCILCRSTLQAFIKLFREGMPVEEIKSKVIRLCIVLNIESEAVCKGAVNLNTPSIAHILSSRPNLTEYTICGVVLESQSCSLNDTDYEWTVKIDDGPPKSIHAEETNNTLNIVQITDIHYDPKYEYRGNAVCGEPNCCRVGQNSTNVNGKLAGYWGDSKCDSPWHAVVDLLDHIKTTHQNISYLYFTGDIIDHGVWETSFEENKNSMNKSYYKIYEMYRNVPVYPILGNHEPHPLNLFAPKDITNELSTQWLYDYVSDLWIKLGWLPQSTRSTIMEGGYYTVLIKKGFRIIVLNSNVAYSFNWWIWYKPQDPDGQLQWLADTLLQAEKDSEFVHILGHLPPNECQSTWRREYTKIINRFSHIVSAQFNGHTHNDELRLFYDSSDIKVHNVAWNGGSATAFTDLNPNYKLHIVNRNNYMVKNIENWMYNLTLANENGSQRPQWYKSYSFKEEYDLPDLSYDSLGTWFSRLERSEELLNRYYRHFVKHAEASLQKNCNSKCMRTHMCNIITSLGDRKAHCNDVDVA